MGSRQTAAVAMDHQPRPPEPWAGWAAALLVVWFTLLAAGCNGDPSDPGPDQRQSTPQAIASTSIDDVVAQVQEYADASVEVGAAPGVLALVRVGDETRVVTAGLA